MGRQVPDAFFDRPDPLPESHFYWRAFCELSTERQIGMGVGPIPYSKAREYAQRYELNEDEWDFFWEIIQDVDSENLKLIGASLRSDDKKANLVSAQDPEGMKRSMENLAKRRK